MTVSDGDPARSIFSEVRAGGEEVLLRLLQSFDAEKEWIDFKRAESVPGGSTPQLGVSDVKNLAKALGGFRNTAGGVVVWGIDCRDGDEPGRRRCEPGLADVGRFRQALTHHLSRVVSPPFPGVELAEVPLRQGGHALVMYVPFRAEGPPVESVWKGERNYYFRVGESFQPIPASVLAAMFGAQPSSQCRAKLEIVRSGVFRHEVWVQNLGRGMAFDLYVVVESSTSVRVDLEVGGSYFAPVPDRTFLADAKFRLPPRGRVLAGHVTIQGYSSAGARQEGFWVRLHAGARHDLAGVTEHRFSPEVMRSVGPLDGVSGPEAWNRLLAAAAREGETP